MLNVLKANGEKEEFSREKLISSIRRAGIPHDLEYEVVSHVIGKLYENIPTFEIYQHITEFLGKSKNPYQKTM